MTNDRDSILKDLKTNLLKAQDQMNADKNKREINYTVGDWPISSCSHTG